MQLDIHHTTAELRNEGVVIRTVQDAVDLLGNSVYLGANGVIVREEQLTPEFFDLKSGIAGEVLQKFSNYRVKLAIVGDFSKYTSKSLRDFIFESNKGGHIVFAASPEKARERLA